jgi:prepilin-type N-terminal cleavage/methylation domain-containing protein
LIRRHRQRARAFTLLEMVITLAVFLLLAGAVFGIMTGVFQSTASLQENQNRRDQVQALSAFLTKQLRQLPAAANLFSYQRGQGEGLVQNGIIYGTANMATAIDATLQPNGYYLLRLTTFSSAGAGDPPPDARASLQTAVTSNDPTLVWTPLLADVKTLDWKFQNLNDTIWSEMWSSTAKPNMIEFSLQPAGDLVATTMDFWITPVQTVTMRLPPSSTNAP